MKRRWTRPCFASVFLLVALVARADVQTIPREKLQGAEGFFLLSGVPMERDSQGRVVKIGLAGGHAVDKMLKRLPEFQHLRELSLQQGDFTEAGLSHLQQLPALRSLELDGRATESGLEILGELKTLRELCLSNCAITDKGFAHLGNLAGLRRLILMDVATTDVGLSQLRRQKNLRELSIDSSVETTEEPGKLRVLPRRRPYGVVAPLTDASLETISQLPMLEKLDLCGTRITGAGLAHLGRLRNLRELYIECPTLADFGPAGLQGFARLRSLGLDAPLTDATLETISKLAALDSLALVNARITDQGLAQLPKMPRLRGLGLKSERITDQAMTHLAAIPGLEVLSLDTPLITDRGIEQLARLTKLKELSITSSEVSKAALEKLQRALPKCEIVGDDLP